MSTLIRSASLTNFTEIAQKCGLDPLALVRAVGLPAKCLSDPDLKIDTNAVVRLLEMADAMDMFCQGTDGEMFDRDGTPWPEADITLVDLATYAREGYNAQLSIAYISLISTVNNIAERDQYLGRPIINVTDEGHIITKNPLLAPYVVKITKMWRKLGAWFWIATQNLEDFPDASRKMLNMMEWWLCLVMPKEEVEQIATDKVVQEDIRKEMFP